jgi:choline transport protein
MSPTSSSSIHSETTKNEIKTMGINHAVTKDTERQGSVMDLLEKKKHFNIWAALGLNYSIASPPLVMGFYLSLAVGAGGPSVYFYSFLIAAFGQLVIVLALAELASAIPHSSGMYTFLVSLESVLRGIFRSC